VIKYVKLIKPIDWSQYTYVWTRSWDNWGNSSTLKIKMGEEEISLIEIQFHTKSRTNMAVRWCYESVLSILKDNLEIVDL
jgi:hypothetical protein